MMISCYGLTEVGRRPPVSEGAIAAANTAGSRDDASAVFVRESS